jgi:hypothetical protein
VDTGPLTLFATVDVSATDFPWPHASLVHFRGRLYAGVQNQVRVYRALANDLTGPFIFSTNTPAAGVVTGLREDLGARLRT